MKFLTFKIVFILSLWQLSAQNINVMGKVTSITDNEPLIGVSVVVIGSNIGTITDIDGKYSLSNIPSNSTLEFSYVGYEKHTETVNGRGMIDVLLKQGSILSEVVVTSFGIQRDKKVLGYGSQSLSADNLMQSNQINVVNALQGKVAGVTINSSGGAPGSGSNINIRGINSISGGNDNQPLFIIDGIIISNSTDAGNVLPSAGTNAINSNEQFMNSNRAGDLNMDDIESINILKGAAATALYGQRAANGAIIITTKKGKAGKTSINYDMSYGTQALAKVPKIQDTYYEGLNGFSQATKFWSFGPPRLDSDFHENFFETFFNTGQSWRHGLSFSGGSDKSTFNSSVSYLNNDGITPNTFLKRITSRLAATYKMNDRLDVGAQINYTNSNNRQPASGDKSIYSSLSFWSPSFDINDYLKEDGTQNNATNGIVDNPRYMAEFSPQNSLVNRVFGDINLTYKLTSWLRAKYQITADYYGDKRARIVPSVLDLGSQVGGFVTEQNITGQEINSNFFLIGNQRLSSSLDLNFTIGNAITQTSSENLGSRGERFVAPGFESIVNTTNQFVFKSNSLRRIVGAFADVRLDYKNFLFFTVTGRNDWSSTLPVANRSIFYPSASVSYILTNSIIKDNDFLSYGKLRASFAQVGKDAPPYLINNYFSPVPGFPFGTVGGFRRDLNIGNPNLLPEITSETEIGGEFTFLNNLFNIEANYFERLSKNQIVEVPVSVVSGYSRYLANAGTIRNKGVELLLGIKPLKGPLRWDIDINWSRIRNKVESMPEDLKEITFVTASGGRAVLRIEEGGSMGDLYGFDWRRDAEGRVLIAANGLPTTDQSKYVKVGNALPDWQGGINNTFTYKGISLNFLLEWRKGGDIVDIGEMNSIRNGVVKFTEVRNKAVVFNGVTADGTPNTTQVILNNDTYRAYGINSHYSFSIQDASWFRVRNVNLMYDVPKSFLNQYANSIRLGISANNLFLSTPFRGYDPEALAFGSGSNLIGFTGRNTPTTRNFNFILNVGF